MSNSVVDAKEILGWAMLIPVLVVYAVAFSAFGVFLMVKWSIEQVIAMAKGVKHV